MATVNVDTLRAGYEALNSGDLSSVLNLISDEIVWEPGELSPDAHSLVGGRAGFEAFVRSWLDAFDDFRVDPYEVIERPPFLIACVHQSGRGRGSGLPIEIEIAHVWTIADGNAVRLQSFRSRDEALAAVD